jgi:hypothetical protein
MNFLVHSVDLVWAPDFIIFVPIVMNNLPGANFSSEHGLSPACASSIINSVDSSLQKKKENSVDSLFFQAPLE